MIVYGTRILTKPPMILDTLPNTEYRQTIRLDFSAPPSLIRELRCGFPLYRAHGRRVFLYSDRPFSGSNEEQPWCYEVEEIVRFYWRGGEKSIYYEPLRSSKDQKLLFWFIHLMLPLYLSLERIYHFFHAGAVQIDGRSVLFLAPSMGGKSTTTDYFLRQGHPLISDDKVATFRKGSQFMAVPSHPFHRPYRAFEVLGDRAKRIAKDIRPIHVLYLLERVASDAPLQFKELRGAEKLDGILPHFLYQFPFLRREQLGYLAPMLSDTPVYRVRVPEDLHRLGELHDAICIHSERLGTSAQS